MKAGKCPPVETSMARPDGFFDIENHKLTLLPPFEHKEPKDDDLGVSEHPIYSNYPKYQWTTHTKTGGVEIKPGMKTPRSLRRSQ